LPEDQDGAGVDANEQGGEQPVDQGAVDDPVDLIQPVAQDGDPSRDWRPWAAGTERRRPMGATQDPGPWAGVLLSDEEALQIIAVLADVLDGHDVRDAVSAAWSLL
jgi:hypothetical protein